ALEPHAGFRREPVAGAKRSLERGLRVDGREIERRFAALEQTEVEGAVEEPREPHAFLVDDVHVARDALGLRLGVSRRISENERMEVMGVRTSWLTWLRKSSFSESSRRRRSFASASSRAAASSWRDFSSSCWL